MQPVPLKVKEEVVEASDDELERRPEEASEEKMAEEETKARKRKKAEEILERCARMRRSVVLMYWMNGCVRFT